MTPSGKSELPFSLKEAAVLSRLSEEKLRREVERDVIDPTAVVVGSAHRLRFGEPEILYFAMLSSLSGTVELSPSTRAKAYRLLTASRPRAWVKLRKDAKACRAWVERLNREWSKGINALFAMNWDALIEEVGARIQLYREGLARIREDDAILGGEPVFDGTRLAVRHIGGMRARGEPAARILADYPDLTVDDIEFARLFAEARPLVGRRKAGAAA
jgi:uncharacterized protein (DUF433 family)